MSSAKRILILEREPITLDARTALENAGFTVVGIAPSWNGADLRLAPDHASAGPAGDRSARGRARTRTDLRFDHRLLLDLGEVMRGAADGGDALGQVSTQLGRHLGASRCRFAQVDLAADRVTAHGRGYTAGAPPVPDRLVLSLFGPEIAAAAARGETAVYCDTSTDPRTAAVFEGSYDPIATRAVVLVPLMRDQRWVAYLVIASSTPRIWSDREVTLVKLVADRAWMWTEHLRLLGERQRTEARYQGLVDSVEEDAIFVLDPTGKVATWSAGAERLKGYRSDEIIGEPLCRLYPPEDRLRAQDVLIRAVRSGRHEEEGWRIRKDGTRFWARAVLTPIYARDGSLEGFAKVTRDVTYRRRHEDELRHQQAILVETRRSREVLLQEVEHRVKNNLQVITSLINMQMRRLEPGAARDELADCRARVLAIAFTHEHLYRSKDYASVHFRDHVRGMVDHILHESDGSAERVTVELAIDDVRLEIDQAMPCALVINELVINALEHGFAGDRRGTIRVELTALGGGSVRLAVRDDGAGLPAGFDLHSARSMGLQLVSTLAEQLGATLAITRGAWTSIELTLSAGESTGLPGRTD